MIRFVIFSSYGNDSCALIQWAHEWNLENVAVVYSDTGWAADGWGERVKQMETWAQSFGFLTYRTKSIGFVDLAHEKKGFPTQQYQWCSYRLKIEPAMLWLAENDPQKIAVCLVGARQEEAKSPTSTRAQFPEYLVRSENHGGRVMLAPFAKMNAEARDAFLQRAGVEPLPHRSRECKCINSNKADFRAYTETDVRVIEDLEAEVGRTMYRPHRHMGAKGIREVVKWAHSPRGKYEPPDERDRCNSGWCE